jgi:CRISPR/Cas system-associated exonuclease Cas4 (RecB family)
MAEISKDPATGKVRLGPLARTVPQARPVPIAVPESPSPLLLPENPTIDRDLPHFSYSQLSTYQRCPWKYYLRYVRGLPDPKSIKAALGSGVHETLEINAKKKIKELKDMDLPDLLDLTSDRLADHLQDFTDDKMKGQIKDEAVGEVTLFRVRDAEKITPLAAEYKFMMQIGGDDDFPDEPKPVLGYIDTIERTPRVQSVPGASPAMVGVVDYKVVGQKRSQAEIDTTGQLVLYDAVITDALGQLPDAIGYRQFGYKKDGPFSDVSYVSPELLDPQVRLMRQERVKQVIRRVQDAIKKGVFYPTDDAKNCSWCPYRQMCQFSQVKTTDRNG